MQHLMIERYTAHFNNCTPISTSYQKTVKLSTHPLQQLQITTFADEIDPLGVGVLTGAPNVIPLFGNTGVTQDDRERFRPRFTSHLFIDRRPSLQL